MTSVVRSGPSRVSHSNVVPTPARRSPTNRMAAASAIQVTWSPMSDSRSHTTSRGAATVVRTRMWGTRRSWQRSAGGQRGQHLGDQPRVDPVGRVEAEVDAVAVAGPERLVRPGLQPGGQVEDRDLRVAGRHLADEDVEAVDLGGIVHR